MNDRSDGPRAADQWPEVNRLLDQALSLLDSERTAWVAALPVTPARAVVERLLGHRARVESADFLGTLPSLSPEAWAGIAGDAPALASKAGDTVGPWRLLRPLGQGGMGAVWLAERADASLKREVALKLPNRTWNATLAERMLRERDILASLTHPHIARLYDAGFDGQGRPYLALEFVDGRPIDQYVRARVPSVRAIVALLLQVADAVAHAHSRLVIHRDLKPSNILIDAQGQARLLDFGIAKLMEGERAEETALTRAAGHVLTPEYASPEQVSGAPLTTSSDVYSLGVVAYELLAGSRPYRLKRGTLAELEEAIAQADPPRASEAATDPAARKALRGDLDAILNKALKKRPEERYATVVAFAEDLRRHLDGHAVLARPDSGWYVARKFVARHRVPVVAAVAAVVALGVGLGVALWQTREAREQARFALQAAGRHEGVRHMYGELLQTIANMDAAAFGQPGSIPNVLKQTLQELEPQYRDRLPEWAGILNAALTHFSFMGDPEAMLATSIRYLEVLHQTRADDRTLVLAYSSASRAAGVLGRFEESERYFRQGMNLAPLSSDPATLKAQFILLSEAMNVMSRVGKRAEARAVLERARRAGVEHLPADRDFATIMQSIGRLETGFDNRAAMSAFEESLRIYAANPETDALEMAGIRFFLGAALAETGNATRAEDLLREAHAVYARTMGPADADTLTMVGWLARALARQERYAEARALLVHNAGLIKGNDRLSRALISSLAARRMEVGWLEGDPAAVSAASADVALVDASFPTVQYVPALLEQRFEQALAGGSLSEADTLLAEMKRQAAGKPLSVDAFRPGLAQVRLHLSRSEAPAAMGAADELLGAMRSAGIVASWQLVVAQEWAAVAAAEARQADRARQWLARAEAAREVAQAPSRVELAESALRQARAARALGAQADAARLAATATQHLDKQHAASPRRAMARDLAASTTP